MWPFTGDGALWLALYVLTFALHAVFVGYVLAGTGYAFVQAVRKADDPIAERVRDRLPFMLGCGITAGVAPLLFIQLLYQHRFYTANLVMGPRWGAVVPALIVGFYALYLAKAKPRFRRAALAVGLACFVFVAWSWTELHLLMQDEPAWRAMYAAGDRIYGNAAIPPRLVLWLGAMLTLFASVALWWSAGTERRRLAVLALAGRVVTGLAVAWLAAAGGTIDNAAHGWLYILAGALALDAIGWLATWRNPDGNGPLLVAAGGAAALLSATVVREAARLAFLEPPHAAAVGASGFPVFALTAVFGVAVIAWIVKTIRGAGGDSRS